MSRFCDKTDYKGVLGPTAREEGVCGVRLSVSASAYEVTDYSSAQIAQTVPTWTC